MKPPWIKYPDYPPYDTFWRQAGESWLAYVWEPYFQRLTPNQKKQYLQKWKVPKVWNDFYFDTQWQKLLKEAENDT